MGKGIRAALTKGLSAKRVIGRYSDSISGKPAFPTCDVCQFGASSNYVVAVLIMNRVPASFPVQPCTRRQFTFVKRSRSSFSVEPPLSRE